MSRRGGETAPGNPTVDRDKRSMERKKRVTEVLEDPFRKQLEGVVVSQKEGNKPLFHSGIKMSGSGSSLGGAEFKGLSNVRQVNDLAGALKDRYTLEERELRCKLAALYRLTAHFEWDHLIYSHITARVPGEEEHFLVNPYGLQYCEMTASSLIKIDMEGNIVDAGSTVLPVNKAGFKLNSALHGAGKGVVYHTHSHAGTAISAMKCGLLNLCQEALMVRPVSYSKYQGLVPNPAEQRQLCEDLLENSNVIILENHGLVSVGPTIEEAFLWMAQLTKACEIQWRVLRSGRDNVTTFPDPGGPLPEGDLPVELVCNPNGREYKTGELEFESYMRMLDGQGANTGYPYKTPTIYKDQLPTYYAVQYPPIVPGMEGCPSDTERTKQSASQRSAWFMNPTPVDQRIALAGSDSSGEDWRRSPSRDPSEKKRDPKQFKSFDSVIGPESGTASSHSSSSSGGKKKRRKRPSDQRGRVSSEEDVPPPRPPLPSHRSSDSTSTIERDLVEEGSVHTEDLYKSDTMGSGYARVLPDGKSVEEHSSEGGKPGDRRESKPDIRRESKPDIRRGSKPDIRRGSKVVESSSSEEEPSTSRRGTRPDIRRGTKPWEEDRPGIRRDSRPERAGDRRGSQTGGTGRPGERPEEGSSSESEGPARPPPPSWRSSSSESFHSTRSDGREEAEDEGLVHEYLAEQRVVTEDWSENLHSIHSSDSDVVSGPSTDGHRSDEADVQSVSSDSHSSEVVVEAPDLADDDLHPIATAAEMGQVQQAEQGRRHPSLTSYRDPPTKEEGGRYPSAGPSSSKPGVDRGGVAERGALGSSDDEYDVMDAVKEDLLEIEQLVVHTDDAFTGLSDTDQEQDPFRQQQPISFAGGKPNLKQSSTSPTRGGVPGMEVESLSESEDGDRVEKGEGRRTSKSKEGQKPQDLVKKDPKKGGSDDEEKPGKGDGRRDSKAKEGQKPQDLTRRDSKKGSPQKGRKGESDDDEDKPGKGDGRRDSNAKEGQKPQDLIRRDSKKGIPEKGDSGESDDEEKPGKRDGRRDSKAKEDQKPEDLTRRDSKKGSPGKGRKGGPDDEEKPGRGDGRRDSKAKEGQKPQDLTIRDSKKGRKGEPDDEQKPGRGDGRRPSRGKDGEKPYDLTRRDSKQGIPGECDPDGGDFPEMVEAGDVRRLSREGSEPLDLVQREQCLPLEEGVEEERPVGAEFSGKRNIRYPESPRSRRRAASPQMVEFLSCESELEDQEPSERGEERPGEVPRHGDVTTTRDEYMTQEPIGDHTRPPGNLEGLPILTHDVTVDARMSVTRDTEEEHEVSREVEVRVGEEGVEVAEEIVQHTVTTSIIEITEIQEDEFEVITVAPGQLTEQQKEELVRQGYVLQEQGQ